jgi:hypothetical protein
MTIVPETRIGKITFYQVHLPVWAQDPASIGLTPEAVADVQQLTDEAREAYRAHYAAQMQARTATAKFHQAVRRMHAGGDGVVRSGAALLQTIKTYAQNTGDPGVYQRAQIAAPSKPGRPGSAAAPGTPYGFRTNLWQTGELELTWKCKNPDGAAGIVYQVKRKLDDGPLTIVGTVGDKKFLDELLPPGTKQCTYQVTAMRSTGKGASASHIIWLGNAYPMQQIMVVKSRKLVA